MYRLHIDIPFKQDDQSECARSSLEIMTRIVHALKDFAEVKEINYRMGNDSDRQKSNYLQIDEKGHCSNKKTKVDMTRIEVL